MKKFFIILALFLTASIGMPCAAQISFISKTNRPDKSVSVKGNVHNLVQKTFRSNDELPDSAMYFYWDSLSWDTSYMEVYKWDANRNQTEIVSKYYTETGTFINSWKTTTTYNQDKEVIENMNYAWDSTSWLPQNRDTYRYINGFPQSSTYEYYDSNQWKISSADSNSYTFNTDNLPTSQISLYYDEFEEKWIPQQKVDITYGTDKKPTQMLISAWNEKWETSMRIKDLKWELGFNLQEAQPTAYTMEYFYYVWIKANKFTSKVQNGVIVSDTNYTWELSKNKWVFDTYTDYSYNTDYQLLKKVTYAWETSWDTSMMEIYQYDTAGNKIYEEQGEKWDQYYEPWMKMRYSYIYGHDHQIRQMITEVYDTWEQAWRNDQKVKYYYASMASITGKKTLQVKVFPNPATDQITLIIPDGDFHYKLMDISGRILTEGSFRGNRQILSLGEFDSGIYLLGITNENGEANLIRLIKR